MGRSGETEPVRARIVAARKGGFRVELIDGRHGWIRRQDLIPGERGRRPEELVGKCVQGLILPARRSSAEVLVSPRAWGRERLGKAVEAGERLDGRVLLLNRGGAVVEVEGVRAFLPRAEMRQRELRSRESLVGSRWRGYALAASNRRLVVSSHRRRVRSRRARSRRRWAARRAAGDVVNAIVVALAPTGLVVRLHRSGVEAFVPGSELVPHATPADAPELGTRTRVRILSLERNGKHGPKVVASQRLDDQGGSA